MSLVTTNPRFAWAIYLVLASYSIFQLFLQGTVGLVADQLKLDFGTDAASIGVLSSVFFYPYILMQIPAGVILDRWGHRRVLTLGMGLVGLSALLFSAASSMEWAMACRVLMGVGCSFGFVGLLSGVTRVFEVRHFPFMVALGETLTMLIASRLNVGASWVIEFWGWRYGFLGASMVAFCISLCLWALLGRFPQSPSPTSPVPSQPLFYTLGVLLKRKEIWAYGVIGGCLFSIVTVFAYLWAVPFVQEAYHSDLYSATSAVAMVYVGIGVFSPVIGILAGYVHKLWLLLVSSVTSGILLSAIIYAPELVAKDLNLAFFVLGMTASGYHMAFAIVGEKTEEQYRTTALGLTNMITMIWAPLLQTGIGMWLSRSSDLGMQVYTVGDYQKALVLLALNLVCAFALVLMLLKKEVFYVLRDRSAPISRS